MRVIGWVFSGLILSIIPLVVVAVTKIDATTGATFWGAITDEELLAVAFTLAGASGIDALISTSHPALRALQIPVGCMAMLAAIAGAAFYIVFRLHAHHMSPEETRALEGALYIGSALLALGSEAVA